MGAALPPTASEAADQAGAGAAGSSASRPQPSASGVVDSKAFWFRTTAAYGALYSALFVLSGHRLLVPTCTHAGLNVGLCLRDWGRMRRTPAEALRRTLALGDD